MMTRQAFEQQMDQQITRLSKSNVSLVSDWLGGIGLFRQLVPMCDNILYSKDGGCITEILLNHDNAYDTHVLSIALNSGLPKSVNDIKLHHLPAFKAAQLAAYDHFHEVDEC